MKSILEGVKGTEIIDDSVCLKSALKEEQLSELDCLAEKIVLSIKESEKILQTV
jgi:hypothetical protein